MPQTNDFFIKNPALNLQCKIGESRDLSVSFIEGKDLSQIVDVVSASGCSCIAKIKTTKQGINFTYTNQLKEEDFKNAGDPLFLNETKYMTIYYKKEGVPNKIRTETGALIFNPELPWESVEVTAQTTM